MALKPVCLWHDAFRAAITTFNTEITESFSTTSDDRIEIYKLMGEKGYKISNIDKPEFYPWADNGQRYLGYRLPRTYMGLGFWDTSIEIKTNIKLYRINMDGNSYRYQTEKYYFQYQNYLNSQ